MFLLFFSIVDAQIMYRESMIQTAYAVRQKQVPSVEEQKCWQLSAPRFYTSSKKLGLHMLSSRFLSKLLRAPMHYRIAKFFGFLYLYLFF